MSCLINGVSSLLRVQTPLNLAGSRRFSAAEDRSKYPRGIGVPDSDWLPRPLVRRLLQSAWPELVLTLPRPTSVILQILQAIVEGEAGKGADLGVDAGPAPIPAVYSTG